MKNPRNVNRVVVQKMLGYCNDIETTLNRFENSFDNYVNDIIPELKAQLEEILSAEE